MNWIKKNKIFILLIILILISFNYFLFLFKEKNELELKKYAEDKLQEQVPATINNFTVKQEKNLLKFAWDVETGDSTINAMEIYHNDKLLANVTNKDTYLLDLLSSDLNTGNNKFKLVIKFSDGNEIEKQIYHYIKEVFDFNVYTDINNDTIYCTLNYIYHKNKPVDLPYVTVEFSKGTNGALNLIEKNKKEINNNFYAVELKYKLNLKKYNSNNYIKFKWYFNEYDLNFSHKDTFTIIK